jgi:hypothetical protein
MSEFKELILKLREEPSSIKKIFDYITTDPVEVSEMPDGTLVVNDGNHRANLLNLLKVEKIPSLINGEFKLIPTELLRRPNGSVGTQGFTSESMIKLINHIFSLETKEKSLFEELIEDKELDRKIVKSFKSKPTLCPSIFRKNNGDNTMREDVRKKLLEIANEYIDFIGVDFFIHDIVLTGSLSNYNWSEFSDVDLHILIDMDEFDNKENEDSTILHKIVQDFFDSKEKVWKSKHDIKIKGFDLEIYVQDVHQEHVSSGVYSVLNNKWVVTPEKTNPKIDDKKILQKGEEYGKQIDNLISKMESGDDISKETKDLYKKIKNFRQSGLESGGEYSYENLTFKLLRRNGYIEKILDLKSKIIDKKLSISEQ